MEKYQLSEYKQSNTRKTLDQKRKHSVIYGKDEMENIAQCYG